MPTQTPLQTLVVQEPVFRVIEVESETIIEEEVVFHTLEIGIPGKPGIPGEQGPPGPSADAAFQYTHVQNLASASWVIVHNLNGFPNVAIVDSAGTNVEGEIVYINNNEIVLNFSSAFSGTAYLS